MALEYEKKDNIEVVVMPSPGEFHYEEHVETDTDKEALVKEIEKYVRSSIEYGDYIAYLRQNVGMDACAFFNNVSKASNRKLKIEIHHAPLTLFDIVKLVLDRAIRTGEEINSLTIAEEVMRIHYMNQVGLIPLSKTLHEVVHNSDKLTIPIYMIFGNYKKFLDMYSEELDMEENKGILKKVQLMIERTKELKAESFDVLKPKFTYYKIDGFEMPVKIEDEKEVKETEKKQSKKAA